MDPINKDTSIHKSQFNHHQHTSDHSNLSNSTIHDLESSSISISIPIHCSILCARSPVFSTLFSSSFVDSKKKIIHFEHVELDTIKRMLLFIYTGTIEDQKYQKLNETKQSKRKNDSNQYHSHPHIHDPATHSLHASHHQNLSEHSCEQSSSTLFSSCCSCCPYPYVVPLSNWNETFELFSICHEYGLYSACSLCLPYFILFLSIENILFTMQIIQQYNNENNENNENDDQFCSTSKQYLNFARLIECVHEFFIFHKNEILQWNNQNVVQNLKNSNNENTNLENYFVHFQQRKTKSKRKQNCSLLSIFAKLFKKIKS
jgi:hypothetical protein